MKFKKWLALLLAMILVLCATACNDSSGNRNRDNENNNIDIVPTPSGSEPFNDDSIPSIFNQNANGPLLYRVTDQNGNSVWLFGSIHMGEDSYYPLPSYITDALENSDGLAVEYDIIRFESNSTAQLGATLLLKYWDGTTIQDHVSPEVYQQAVTTMQQLGIYDAAYSRFKPILWSNLIDDTLRTVGDRSLGVDRHLIQMAYDLDLPVLDIESADFQYSMLFSYSDELQELLLKTSTMRYDMQDEYNSEIQKLMDTWRSGNARNLREILSIKWDELTQEERVCMEEYYSKMFTERDITMTDYVIDALSEGEKLFICVGAGHVVGENGIVEQLLSKGYTVELVK